jgi:redox-sensitive bicupin YhaK (pirin superfamily)
VHLFRAFGPRETRLVDPFLLLDDFHSNDPRDYIAGFPWHPHRGIETVTYMIRGVVEHGDSIGNTGAIGSGDVQWMTAGSGILHQEMPQKYDGMFQGFQLWVNLPSSKKMMAPRYREVKGPQIPSVELAEGVVAKVIAGEAAGVRGSIRDLVVSANYLDVEMGPSKSFEIASEEENTQLAYVHDGEALLDPERRASSDKGKLAIFGPGNSMRIKSGPSGARILLVSGKPLREQIAWGGPIVMNTEEELSLAFRELREGTFIKDRAKL